MRKKAKEKEKPVVYGVCAVPACGQAAEYKAPKSRHNTGEYQYLCLDHVREFNQAWDYFDGWSRQEIEDFMDAVPHGHKPTWTMSSRLGGDMFFSSEKLRDSFFEMFGEKPPSKKSSINRKERDAFAVLDLEPDASLALIKSQYKKLVKKHHPDVNKGDKTSEETFKRITVAYKLLLKTYGNHDEK